MESLKGSMSELMSHFQERMAKFEAELTKAPNTSASGTVNIAAEYTCFKTFILESLGCLQRQMDLLARNIDTLEMRSRRKMLLVHGVAEQSKEETALVVAGVIRDHVGMESFSVASIRRCHRMGRQKDVSKPRPILMKLQDVDTRDKIWFGKAKLKGSGITLSEFLTKSRHQVFMAARERFGVSCCWTKQGHIHIIGPDSSRHRVATLSELNAIAEPEPESETQEADNPVTIPASTAAAPKRRRAVANKK